MITGLSESFLIAAGVLNVEAKRSSSGGPPSECRPALVFQGFPLPLLSVSELLAHRDLVEEREAERKFG